jgi:hypothetical protein
VYKRTEQIEIALNFAKQLVVFVIYRFLEPIIYNNEKKILEVKLCKPGPGGASLPTN